VTGASSARRASEPGLAPAGGPLGGPDHLVGIGRTARPKAAERQRILDALEQCAWNQTRAAKLLNISLRTLVTRLTEHDIPRPRRR
jgi:DNA-binding NtrC family response regulator